MSSNLSNQKCVPCEGGTPPLTDAEAQKYIGQISGWTLDIKKQQITKKYKFADFVASMAFVNKIAALAEKLGHHPDLFISYNNVTITLTTHAIKGLSINDFIVAAK